MLKILIGGSPCTHWSIAKKDGRETEPSGIGWELFLNYEIARKLFKYAMTVANSNHPDIIQHGDAFAIRGGLAF